LSRRKLSASLSLEPLPPRDVGSASCLPGRACMKLAATCDPHAFRTENPSGLPIHRLASRIRAPTRPGGPPPAGVLQVGGLHSNRAERRRLDHASRRWLETRSATASSPSPGSRTLA